MNGWLRMQDHQRYAKILRHFLASEGIKPGARYEVYLSSSGGSLVGGLRLGAAPRYCQTGSVASSVRRTVESPMRPMSLQSSATPNARNETGKSHFMICAIIRVRRHRL
jgi:hypothetical protein